MSQDMSDQLVKTLKNLINDHGMPRSVEDISDPEFRSIAAAHADEFSEARAECESDLTLC